MRAFKAKDRILPILGKIPVKLSLNPHTPLIGALQWLPSMQGLLVDYFLLPIHTCSGWLMS